MQRMKSVLIILMGIGVSFLIQVISPAAAQTIFIPCTTVLIDLPPHRLLDTSDLNWRVAPPTMRADQALWNPPFENATFGNITCIYDTDLVGRFSATANTPANFACEPATQQNKLGLTCSRQLALPPPGSSRLPRNPNNQPPQTTPRIQGGQQLPGGVIIQPPR